MTSKGNQSLGIGDKVTEELWNQPLQRINSLDGIDKVTLNEYRMKKLIILDFWATWCVPCIRSLKKLDSLQQYFGDDLLVIPITYEDPNKVVSLFKRNGWSLRSVVLDTKLKEHFPHQSIPHQVWISRGEVAAITSASLATHENISAFLKGEKPQLKEKKELEVNLLQPITKSIPPFQKVFLQSYMLGYVDGIGNSGFIKNDSVKGVYLFNRPILSMFRTILGVPYSHIMLNVSDLGRFFYKNGDFSNIYSYQLLADNSVSDSTITARCLSDLTNFFRLKLDRRKVYIDSYALQSFGGQSSEMSKEDAGPGALDVDKLIASLEYTTNWKAVPIRFINESNYKGYFRKSILQFENFEELKENLKEYGVTLVGGVREFEFNFISEL